MHMQNHRSSIRKFGVLLMSLTMSLGGTTFSGAFDADNLTDKGAMNQVFVLPPDREQTPENIALVSKQLDAGRPDAGSARRVRAQVEPPVLQAARIPLQRHRALAQAHGRT